MLFLAFLVSALLALFAGEGLWLLFFGNVFVAGLALVFLINGFPSVLTFLDGINKKVELNGSVWQKLLFVLELVLYLQVVLLPPWLFLGESVYFSIGAKTMATPIVGLGVLAINQRWGLKALRFQRESA